MAESVHATGDPATDMPLISLRTVAAVTKRGARATLRRGHSDDRKLIRPVSAR